MASASSRITLVLVGKTGHGKSATGNSILGAKAFDSKRSGGSITSQCDLKTATLPDRREIHVIDTPGLCDTQRSAESINLEISNCLVLAKDGVNALVLVLSADARCTDEEIKAAESLHLIFGKEVMKYLVVVFTRGDQLDDDQTLDNYLEGAPAFLHGFLRKCNDRKVVFDNKTTNKVTLDSQRNNLVRVIDDMVRRNGGQPYTCEALKAAQDHALKMEQEKSKVKREKYEQVMFQKIDEITRSNARKNEAAIEERLEDLARKNKKVLRQNEAAIEERLEDLARTNKKVLWQNEEANNRKMERLRTELNNVQAEVTHLRHRMNVAGCPIS